MDQLLFPLFLLSACSLAVEGTDFTKLLGNVGVSETFGASVALSGDGLTALVGASAQGGLDALVTTGAVYHFSRPSADSDVWTQQARVTPDPEQAGASFGYSVAVNSDATYMLVGSPDRETLDIAGAGAVFLFSRPSATSSTWTAHYYLTSIPEIQRNMGFGTTISMTDDGLTAVIGAPNYDLGYELQPGSKVVGAAYVFTRDPGSHNWGPPAQLLADDVDGAVKDVGFGTSVALSSNGGLTACVGSVGTAYVFARPDSSSNVWTKQGKLKAGGPAEEQAAAQFGLSVSLDGNGLVAVVGAKKSEENEKTGAGAAFFFARPSANSSEWMLQQKVTAGDSELESNAQFGENVVLSGNGLVALVGASRQDEGGLWDAGAAQLFMRPTTSSNAWSRLTKLSGGNHSDVVKYAQFGWANALSADGSVALVGAFKQIQGSAAQAGAAYVISHFLPPSNDQASYPSGSTENSSVSSFACSAVLAAIISTLLQII